MNQDTSSRVTDFGSSEVELINGKKYKVRSLTIKEKKEYLALVDKIKKSKIKKETDVAKEYLELQVDVAVFLLSKMNENVTREEVEEGVTGEILKQIVEKAFYDPFSVFKV